MKHASFIIGSYVVTFGVLVGYAAGLLRRARRLGKAVPQKDRPWT
jgi:heme exporter protein CcmD